MASTQGHEVKTDDDPWRVAACISALMELFLSVLLLLNAAIAFITARLVKSFGLEPPCTYIGCSHTLLDNSSKRQRYSIYRPHPENCLSEPCRNCYTSLGYARLHSEEFLFTNDGTNRCLLLERDDSSSRDSTAVTSDLDVCNHRYVNEDPHRPSDYQNVNCSCSDSSSPLYKKPSRAKYLKPKVSILGSDDTAKEECIPLFSTSSVSPRSGHSDDESSCEMSFTSKRDHKMPRAQREMCLEKNTSTDGDALMHNFEGVARNSEDEHHYKILECEDEEVYEAPFFYSFEAISRDSKGEHCYMLLESEDEAPFLGNLQSESAQPLLQYITEDELEGPELATMFESANKVANEGVVIERLLDIEHSAEASAQCELVEDSRDYTCTGACDLTSRPNDVQNTGALSLPLKATGSILEDEMLDVWDEGHMKKGFSAHQINTDSIQGSGNIKLANSADEALVEGQIGSDGIVKIEDLDAPLTDLLYLHCLEKEEEVSAKGSLLHLENEFMALGDLHKVDKIQGLKASESSLEIVAEEVALVSSICGPQLHKEGNSLQDVVVQEGYRGVCNHDLDKQFLKVQSMLLESQQEVVVDPRSQINCNDATNDVCSRNATLVQDFQAVQVQKHIDEFKTVPIRTGNDACNFENVPIHKGVHEVSTGPDLHGIHEDALSKKGIEEGCSILDGYVHETEGQCDGETISKGTFESVIQEAMNQYLVSFRGSLMEDVETGSLSSLEDIDAQQVSVERVGDYLDVVKGNRLEEENMEKPCRNACSHKVDLSSRFYARDAEMGAQQQEILLERCVPSLQVMNAEQDKEETTLEEDQEQGLDALREALRAERTFLAALETELENERNATAIATSEAMAMISRLQEEKSAMQMEVTQLQRLSEEKADYDEKAMELLKEILFKREKEKHALEKEVELYRERLLAEKVDMATKSSAENESKDPLMPSLTPVLLIRGTDEDQDTILPHGRNDRLKALPSLEEFYDHGITNSPHRASMGQNIREEHFGLSPQSVELKETKRSRTFHLNDQFQEDKGRFVDPFIGGTDRLHDTHQEMSRSIFSTNEEEKQFILDRLWVLEEELQELRGQDRLGAQEHNRKSLEGQHLDGSPMKRKSDRSCADSCGVRCIDGKTGGDTDAKSAGMFLPVHDVFEVQLAPNHCGQQVEGSDALECSEDMPEDLEVSPRDISQGYMATSSQSHRPQVLSRARRSSPRVETHCDSALTRNQDFLSFDDSHAQRLKATEGGLVTADVMQQLAVRLQMLETDRELLREISESFRHRDAELNLLQEVAQHLRELRTAGFGRASAGGVLQGSFSLTFGKSCVHALKKRRYCGEPSQTQMLLIQQKSI